MLRHIFKLIAKRIPELRQNLKKAGMQDKPEVFIKKTFLTAFYMSFGLLFSFGLVLLKFKALKLFMLIFIPILFAMFFMYFLKLPTVKISKKEKEVMKEIVFAGRHLIIELESGVPLYNAMINISKNYEFIGAYFRQIIDRVDLGTSMEEALTESIERAPSNDFRRLLWQVLNSIQTGSEISNSLTLVMEQIAREQNIQVSEYGRKLNPLAMFYMMIAVILPSLGITMLIVISSFVDFQLDLTALIFIAFMLGFLQFMFLSIIRFSRPAIEF